jgi:hypothetical protein
VGQPCSRFHISQIAAYLRLSGTVGKNNIGHTFESRRWRGLRAHPGRGRVPYPPGRGPRRRSPGSGPRGGNREGVGCVLVALYHRTCEAWSLECRLLRRRPPWYAAEPDYCWPWGRLRGPAGGCARRFGQQPRAHVLLEQGRFPDLFLAPDRHVLRRRSGDGAHREHHRRHLPDRG